MTRPWSDRATLVISGWQEHAYGELAVELGFGWNPKKAHEFLSPPPVDRDDWHLSIDRFKQTLGADYVTAGEWRGVEDWWEEYKRQYYFPEPPTPFEEWNIYSNAAANLESLRWAIEQVLPGRLTKTTLIATLPTGEMNAFSRRIRGTDEVAILLQRGVMGALYHFGNIVAGAIPTGWIKSERPVPAATSGRPGDAEHVSFARQYLVKLLDAYVVEGSPYRLRDPQFKGPAFYNQSLLAATIRQFPICHELMHVTYGHVGTDKSTLSRDQHWSREYAADLGGATIVAGLVASTNPGSQITNMWACDVALAGFEILERAVAYLNTGADNIPGTNTHPSLVSRREELYRAMYSRLADDGLARQAGLLQDLYRKGGDVIYDLRSHARPHLTDLRRAGVKPSPIWRPRDVPQS